MSASWSNSYLLSRVSTIPWLTPGFTTRTILSSSKVKSINQSITSKVSSSLKALGNQVAFLRRWRKVSSPAPQLALTSSGRTSLATQLCLFKKPKSVISGIQHLQMRTRMRQLNSFTGSQMAKARSFRFVWWLCWCDCFYCNCVDMIVVIVIVLMLLLLFWLSCCDCCYCDCVVVIVVIVIVLLWLLLMWLLLLWLLLLLMLFSSAGKWNQPCSPSSPCPAGAGDCDGSDCRTGLFSPKQISLFREIQNNTKPSRSCLRREQLCSPPLPESYRWLL